MRRNVISRIIFIVSLVFISSQNIALGATISFDQLATSSDLTVAKYNADLNKAYQKINSAIQTDNIQDDTLLISDFADESDPAIRTLEGASCEKVDDGLLTTTTSGTLTGSVPTGTAYPRGIRCDKTSSTPKTFTASKWTYVDIDSSCNFQYTEVAHDSSAPAVATNSIRLSRVSTDGTEVTNVQDLRTTNCTSGPFNDISDKTSQASLGDLLRVGQTNRRYSNAGNNPEGFVQGLFVSWDSHTTFKVTTGGAVINGLYRVVSSDVTVPSTADNPGNGTSGLDTGAIGGPSTYYVYGVADQDDVATLSVSISTNASTPTGVTNYRLLGQIKTDAGGHFKSKDVLTVHGINEVELIGGWIAFDGAGTPINSEDSFNVSSVTDNGTGDYTVTWDIDYNTDNYPVACEGMETPATAEVDCMLISRTAGAARIQIHEDGGTARDADAMAISIGDTRR